MEKRSQQNDRRVHADEVSKKTPDFSIAESGAKTVSLSDFRGDWVVLFWRKQMAQGEGLRPRA